MVSQGQSMHTGQTKLLCFQAPQALVQSQRAMNLSPCHFARHGLTESVEAHRPDPTSFVFRHRKLLSKVREQCISRLAILLVMVSQDQSIHTGQSRGPLFSGTSSSSSKSESNYFVASSWCSPWSHRISRSTQTRPKLLCLHAPQALVQSQRTMHLSPCLLARHGLTGSADAHRPDPSSFVFRHLKL